MFKNFQLLENFHNTKEQEFEATRRLNKEKANYLLDELSREVNEINTLKITMLNNNLETFKKNMNYIGFSAKLLISYHQESFDSKVIKFQNNSQCTFYECIDLHNKNKVTTALSKIFMHKNLNFKLDMWIKTINLELDEDYKLLKNLENNLNEIKRLKELLKLLLQSVNLIENEFCNYRVTLADIIENIKKSTPKDEFELNVRNNLNNDEYKILYAYKNIIYLLKDIIKEKYIYTNEIKQKINTTKINKIETEKQEINIKYGVELFE